MINVIRRNSQQPLEHLTSQEHEMSSVTLRYKMGGRHFSEVYMFLMESGKSTLNVLFFGDVVRGAFTSSLSRRHCSRICHRCGQDII